MRKNPIAVVLFLAAGTLITAPGCSKSESEHKAQKCHTGELKISAKVSKTMGAAGAPDRFDCPTRLSTQGAGPPMESWVGGAEAYWGPELIVLLNKEKTEPNRKKGEADCFYDWKQGPGCK